VTSFNALEGIRPENKVAAAEHHIVAYQLLHPYLRNNLNVGSKKKFTQKQNNYCLCTKQCYCV